MTKQSLYHKALLGMKGTEETNLFRAPATFQALTQVISFDPNNKPMSRQPPITPFYQQVSRGLAQEGK